MPPLKKSDPFGVFGLGVSDGLDSTRWNVAPPSFDSYRPTCGAPGGVKRPPNVAEAPWRATAVPRNRCCGLLESTAIAPMPRSFATATLPGTRFHSLPAFVDL